MPVSGESARPAPRSVEASLTFETIAHAGRIVEAQGRCDRQGVAGAGAATSQARSSEYADEKQNGQNAQEH